VPGILVLQELKEQVMKELFWDFFDSWEEAERAWDERAELAAQEHPLDIPRACPAIPQIATQSIRLLRLRGLSWVIRHDKKGRLIRFFLRHPFRYLWRFAPSLFRKTSFVREGDFFYYGIKNLSHMHEILKQDDTMLFVGFSYCEKPKECPALRFSNACIADEENKVCQQCFIGKVRHALPSVHTIFSIAPTINAIGEELVQAITANPNKQMVFLISSCEMALTMFGDLGVMAGLKGIGVKLEGRICNTMQAFTFSEHGVKPGMTWLSTPTQRKMLDLIRFWREESCSRLF
jgi:hypothetical protein